MFKSFDFHCKDCSLTFDSLIDHRETQTECPECKTLVETCLSSTYFGTMNDPVARKASLKKRSQAHTWKEYGVRARPRKPQ